MASDVDRPLSGEERRAVEPLASMDAALDAARVRRLTLAPGRPEATPLAELARAALAAGPGRPDLASALASELGDTARSLRQHFPGNLFWDLDALVGALTAAARAAPEPTRRLSEGFALVRRLHALFGRSTPLRFRYVHDFVYGFDWSRWVARDPSARAAVGPYDPAFLRRMLGRGQELLSLIEADDDEYPQLAAARHRNPFGFCREPAEEVALHRDLAARGLLPVQAWRLDGAARWDRPFTELRDERARALGLSGAEETTRRPS